jgi:hypothetical protein
MKSILFTPGNVKAIYDGLKWQTRRKINHFGNELHYDKLLGDWGLSDKPKHIEGVNWEWTLQTELDDNRMFKLKCPYKVSDILYVKETWAYQEPVTGSGEEIPDWVNYIYKVDNPSPDWRNGKWKSPLFMPEKSARLFIEITNVRVEKLQDISEQDAITEGVQMVNYDIAPSAYNDMQGDWGAGYRDYMTDDFAPNAEYPYVMTAKESYQTLWESIHGPGSWNLNPWVFTYDFKRVEKPKN